MKILLIENTRNLLRVLKSTLENEGYVIDILNSIDEIEDYVILNKYDLIILGKIPSGYNKFDFFEIIRSEVEIPVIFIVNENSKEDILRVLESGAEDYITEPFDEEILLAKIKRCLNKKEKEIIKYKETYFNLCTGTVEKLWKSIKLTNSELEIIKLLYYNKDKIISKENIVNKTALKFEATDRVAISHIHNIRKKLSIIDGDDPIENRWGYGYMWKNR